MRLLYKGFMRLTSGSGMPYSEFTKEIPLKCEKTNLEIPYSSIFIKSINDEMINFVFSFFNKEQNYTLHVGEETKVCDESNAFAFEITFTLEE